MKETDKFDKALVEVRYYIGASLIFDPAHVQIEHKITQWWCGAPPKVMPDDFFLINMTN